MPWHALCSPFNTISHKPYRGINILLLWAAAQKYGYGSNEWGTYRQWQEIGGQVRKGEHSSLVVFWKFFDTDKESDELQEESAGTKAGRRPRCMARAYHVFNAAQVDGASPKLHDELPESERIAHAEAFFEALPGTVLFGGDRAYYALDEDVIHTCRCLASSNRRKDSIASSVMNTHTSQLHHHA